MVSSKAEKDSADYRPAGTSKVVSVMDDELRETAGLAHDMNTVLTTIYGYCEIALEAAGHSSEAGKAVRKIIESADRARNLTEQMLNVCRHKISEPEFVRLADSIYEAVSFINPLLPERVRIIVKGAKAKLHVRAYPFELFRVFLNIIVNAVQAMEEEGGQLTVSIKSVTMSEDKDHKEGKFALIRFSDTGKGMDTETAERIFEPFYSKRIKGKGIGLGMAVVHDIVTRLGGRVTVSSKPGRGTVSDILIPLDERTE